MAAVPSEHPRGGTALAVSAVLLGCMTVEVGAALAITIFPQTGPVGIVTLRLVFAAIILLIAFRPRLRGRTRADWLAAIGLGLVLGAMNVVFYLALERLPLGATVTIEYLGPLILSVVVARRASAWVWAVLAFGGVVLLSRGGLDHLDPVGILLALAAGTCWAGYILLTARVGSRFSRLDGLAIAMTVGALAVLPLGIGVAGPILLQPHILLIGLAVAVLSSAIPYGLEMLALRRLHAATFSILLSLAPAIAAIAGLVLLNQQLTALDAVAIALVVVASMGAVRWAQPRARVEPVP
ncbi:MAG TPA: EamA family transporter [Pseudolysinimonas sp.]|nr:EamA family transporter [Pseudolysinimonas sp.]